MKKYEEFDSNRDFSSISIENFDFKITPHQVRHISDSFESSALIRNESDNSFISQISAYEDCIQKSSLKPAKSCTPLRQPQSLSRPLSVLKTTFLDDLSPSKFNLPKKVVPDLPKPKSSVSVKNIQRPEVNFSSNKNIVRFISSEDDRSELKNRVKNNKQYISSEDSQRESEIKSNILCMNSDDRHEDRHNEYRIKNNLLGANSEDKYSELENQIIKKDALIETLRTRVAKMVEELEETHRKLNLNKVNLRDEYKILELQNKCEDYERQAQNFYCKEKELNLCLDKKDEEIQILSKELKSMRIEIDRTNEGAKKVENELDCCRKAQEYNEKVIEGLKIKLENTSKAIEFSSSHKVHLEQEVVRLEIVKRAHENEMNVIIEENNKNLANLKRKNEELNEESLKFQRLWKESSKSYEAIKASNLNLTRKLEYLEDQMSKIDRSIRIPLREKQGVNFQTFETDPNEDFTNLCTGCSRVQIQRRNKSDFQTNKGFIQEIIESLGVYSESEVVPAIKKLVLTGKEKRLIKKIMALVKQCLDKDKNTEISCAQVWKIIKKVFEEYARMVQDYGNEIKVLRQYFGQNELVDKLIAMSQENKKMKEALGYS